MTKINRRCEDCQYWDNSAQLDKDGEDTGQCRVNPPRLQKCTGRAVWPFTEADDWCGRFYQHPEKVKIET